MNKAEARAIAAERLRALREIPWAELRDRYLNNAETNDVVGDSGTVYQVQTLVVWDDKKESDLRVMVAIDDGGWRAFFPLSDDFIIAPDGSFVGE